VTPEQRQDIFNKVATHLLKQDEPSFRTDMTGGCAYRGVGGLRCAIGALIPDEKYTEEIEGRSAAHVSVIQILNDSGYTIDHDGPIVEQGEATGTDVDFLIDLQELHDFNDPLDWFELLVVLAKKYSLRTSAIAHYETCPECGISFKGAEIPEDSREHFGGATHFLDHKIGIYDRSRDRTTHWRCTACAYTWEREL
jgi:rubredoxin